VETPEANLVTGMKWLQGTYTQRYNRRHALSGHLFQGRYKAISVEADHPGYLEAVSTYIHLNPARAGLVEIGKERLKEYPWSSYPWYLARRNKGPVWLSQDRVLEALRIENPKGYEAYIEGRVLELGLKAGRMELEQQWKALRRGWYVGSGTFLETLRQRLGQMCRPARRQSHSGGAKVEHGQVAAEAMVRRGFERLGIAEGKLGDMQKKAPEKTALAWWLRQRTTVSLEWVSERLKMGHPANVSHAVNEANRGTDRKIERLKARLMAGQT
jgi:hypothetical protein